MKWRTAKREQVVLPRHFDAALETCPASTTEFLCDAEKMLKTDSLPASAILYVPYILDVLLESLGFHE